MEFYKYQAAGNDFIILEDGEALLSFDTAQVRNLCHRQFGIGADGIILLQGSKDHQFNVVHYNADGSRAEMCGNGVRAVTAFARRQWDIPLEGSFEIDDGPHRYDIRDEGIWVEILANPEITMLEQDGEPMGCLDSGVPHAVLVVTQFDPMLINDLGVSLNEDERFPRGTNVNFVKLDGPEFQVRTYERGVNAETLACGTGATATALYLHAREGAEWPIRMRFPGGELMVDKRQNGYWLTGPVELVFTGSLID